VLRQKIQIRRDPPKETLVLYGHLVGGVHAWPVHPGEAIVL
jgi:hypothetical protein